MCINVKLDLSKHCIATEIRRIYSRSISAYLKGGADGERLEKVIEFAKAALESVDFPRLRAEYPLLAGKTDCSAELLIGNGKATVVLEGQPVRIL